MMRRLLNSNLNKALYMTRHNFFSWSEKSIGAFPMDTPHLPHTEEYLLEQKKYFQKYKVPYTIGELLKGTRLWTFTVSGDLLLGAQAVYPKESLKKLSKQEFDKILSWQGNHLAEVEIKESISCISAKDKNDKIVHYVYPGKLNFINRTYLDKCVEENLLSIDPDLDRGSYTK